MTQADRRGGWRARSRVDRRGRQRGATMVEAAIVLPLFLVLLFGIAEVSLLVRDYTAIANITTAGGRAASTFGNDAAADYEIIQDIEQAAVAVGTARIQRIVIFKATGFDSTVPSNCTSLGGSGSGSAGVSGSCNVYWGPSMFAETDPAKFDCQTTSTYSSRFWCPTTRKVALTGTNSPPDYLGIYVELSYRPFTGIFSARTISRTAIYRLEPQDLSG